MTEQPTLAPKQSFPSSQAYLQAAEDHTFYRTLTSDQFSRIVAAALPNMSEDARSLIEGNELLPRDIKQVRRGRNGKAPVARKLRGPVTYVSNGVVTAAIYRKENGEFVVNVFIAHKGNESELDRATVGANIQGVNTTEWRKTPDADGFCYPYHANMDEGACEVKDPESGARLGWLNVVMPRQIMLQPEAAATA